MIRTGSILAAVAISAMLLPAGEAMPSASAAGGFLRRFPGAGELKNRSWLESEQIEVEDESYYLYVPKNYTGGEPFGLLLFISPDASMEVPEGWKALLERRKLLYIAPQKVGNGLPAARRAGVSLAGVDEMMKAYHVDPRRIYASGLSGGARVGCMSGFAHPELYAGVIAICGAEYDRPVPKVNAARTDAYGFSAMDPGSVRRAKQKVRFAFVTGEKDFRRGNVLDIYHGGFAKDHFQAKLWDVRGMGHELCTAKVLGEALDFIEGRGGCGGDAP